MSMVTDFTGIGKTNSKSFKGTYDGGNCTVSNLTIDTTDNYAGLFGIVGNGGTVKNLNVDNADITANNVVGGLVGESYGTISNCTLTNSSITSKGNYAGGIVGISYNTTSGGTAATISGCIVDTVTVKAASNGSNAAEGA